MRIVDLLNKDSILLNGAPKSKTEAIDMLVELQMKSGNISDREIYKQGILAREEKGSTAVGEGIAIPHAKSSAVKAPSLAAMTVPAIFSSTGHFYSALIGFAAALVMAFFGRGLVTVALTSCAAVYLAELVAKLFR